MPWPCSAGSALIKICLQPLLFPIQGEILRASLQPALNMSSTAGHIPGPSGILGRSRTLKSRVTSLSISPVMSVVSLVHHSILQSIALPDEVGLAFPHSLLPREDICGQESWEDSEIRRWHTVDTFPTILCLGTCEDNGKQCLPSIFSEALQESCL